MTKQIEKTTEEVSVEVATQEEQLTNEVEVETPTVEADKPKSTEEASGEDQGDEEEVRTKRAYNKRSKEPSELTVGVFKLNEHTKDPAYGTEHSACFDIRVNLAGVFADKGSIKVFDSRNQSYDRTLREDEKGIYVDVRPHERIIAPTGAIFDIPVGYSLKVHPRSGTSLKQGINLINQEAVIDADYVEELFLLLVNTSDTHVKIYHDERYAQGELQQVTKTTFAELTERPELKSDRVGGLGHTGVK